MNLRILNCEYKHFSKIDMAELEKLGQVTHVTADRDYLIQNISNYDILVTALANTIDRRILELAPRLKYIVTPTTGHNHIDCDFAQKKNIQMKHSHLHL